MSAAKSWTQFLSLCLLKRPDEEEFANYLQLQHNAHPISPLQLCDLFLRPTEHNAYSLDVQIRECLPIMQKLGLIHVPAVLKILLRYSTFGGHANALQGADAIENKNLVTKRWKSSYYSDEMIIYKMARIITSGGTPESTQQAVELLLVSIQWIELVAHSGQNVNDMLMPTSIQTEIRDATTALATLMVAVIDNATVQQAIMKGNTPKGTGNRLSRALANFISLLQHAPAIVERLQVFHTQTLVTIQPVDKKEMTASKEIDEMLGQGIELVPDDVTVSDIPIVQSRAGLYIYFNALLVGRPLMDDSQIINYLQTRYAGDAQYMAEALIIAAFDVLANVTWRKDNNDKEQSKFVFQSFLMNKVPLIIAQLYETYFPPVTSEVCIGNALAQVSTNLFPTFFSLGADSSYDNMFSGSVRQDFCFACCLHGLLEEPSIETLLGDVPMSSLPAAGKHNKDSLFQQCLSDPEKSDALIEELENMDGNVGAVSQAITMFIRQLCRNKDTMSLKSLCAKLARKGAYLDVMLLFDKPQTILQPLCELLDSWSYEEDQGEYQPVYEEFGSILLLVLAFVYRYDLSITDIGINSPSSFVSKLLKQGGLSRLSDSLSQTEKNQLHGWIIGLFDNESSGLGDELMSTCPPRDFYLLVPNLFQEIILAFSNGYLSEESLKGGLEYLAEPFLLPALIPGINWLSSHLWESRGDANAVLQILSTLVNNPNTSSGTSEASHLLNSVLNIIAKSLEHSLRWLQRGEPTRQDIEPLLKTIRPNMGWERRGASDHIELESWTKADNNHVGMTAILRTTILGLVQWALNPAAVNVNPTAYTHRQILVGNRILTAKKVLSVIIDEVKGQTDLGNGGAIIDVATALICAPDTASWEQGPNLNTAMGMNPLPLPLQRRMTLREALKTATEQAAKAAKEDPAHAEHVVRLYRSVEAQLVSQAGIIGHDGLPVLDVLPGMGDLGTIGAVGGDLGGGDAGMGNVLDAENDLMSGLLGNVGGADGMGGDLGDGMVGDMDASDLFGDAMDFS